MNDTRIETAVALLKARDETIAALQATIREKDITIRHLKALLEEQEAELAAREHTIMDLFLDRE